MLVGGRATVHQRGNWFLFFKKEKKEYELFLRHTQEAYTFQEAAHLKKKGLYLWVCSFFIATVYKMPMANTLKNCIFLVFLSSFLEEGRFVI